MVVDQTTWQLDCPKTGVANLRDVRLKLSLDKKWDTYLLKQRYNWYTIATQIANYLLFSSLINEERLDINGIFIKYSHKIPFFFSAYVGYQDPEEGEEPRYQPLPSRDRLKKTSYYSSSIYANDTMLNMADTHIYVNMLNSIDSDYCTIDDYLEERWKKTMNKKYVTSVSANLYKFHYYDAWRQTTLYLWRLIYDAMSTKTRRGTVTPKCTPKRTRRDKDIDLKSNFLTTATLNPLHALKAESSRGHISSSRNIKLGMLITL